MPTTPGPSNYREAGSEPRIIHVLDFDRLPMAIKARLLRSLTGKSALQPLAKETRDERLPFLGTRTRCLAAGFVALGVETYLWFRHFGEVFDLEAFQPMPYAALHGLAVGTLSLSILALIYVDRLVRRAPLPAGKYLFPLDLLEVDGNRITVTSLATMRDVELAPDAQNPELALHFEDGGWVRLAFGTRGDPRRIFEAARKEILAARELVAREERVKAKAVDPLFEVRLANKWAACEPLKGEGSGKRVSPRQAFLLMLGVSLIVGGFYGPLLWSRRNEWSDDAMFDQVRGKRNEPGITFDGYASQYERVGRRHVDDLDDVRYERAKGNRALLSDYLRWSQERKAKTGRAGKHADEVDDELFAIAEDKGTAEAFQSYLEHGTMHAEEVQKEILPKLAFADAQKQPRAKAYADVARMYKGSPLAEKAREALHERYRKLRGEFSDRAPSHPEGMAFCVGLLDELDKRADPRVVLQVVAGAPKGLAEVDKALASGYGARYEPAATSFEPKVLLDLLGSKTSKVVKDALEAAFSDDIEILESSEEPGLPRISVELKAGAAPDLYKAHDVGDRRGTKLAQIAVYFTIRMDVAGKNLEPMLDSVSSYRRNPFAESPAATLDEKGDISAEQRRNQHYWKLVWDTPEELKAYLDQTL